MIISMPIVWTILIVLFLIVEAVTLSLVSIWLAIGSIAGLILSLLNFSTIIQILVSVIVTLIMLFLTRPFVSRHLKVGINKTNVDSLIGVDGIVTKKVTRYNNGLVKVNGQIWTAKSFTNETIDEGRGVIVVSIEGVKLIVKRSD